jgi:hypothetical protein
MAQYSAGFLAQMWPERVASQVSPRAGKLASLAELTGDDILKRPRECSRRQDISSGTYCDRQCFVSELLSTRKRKT